MGHTTLPFKLSTKISITCSSVIIFIELIKREVYSKEKKIHLPERVPMYRYS